eukprot:jgi/Ulvmu1/6453/UM003_0083.1
MQLLTFARSSLAPHIPLFAETSATQIGKMLSSAVSVSPVTRPCAAAPRSRALSRFGCNAVPARVRRGPRGMRLSPLDPFFGMELAKPFFDSEGAAGSLADRTRHMAIDIVENESAYTVKADIPGVKKEDIGIDVDGDHVSLSVRNSAESETEDKDDKGVTFHRIERSSEYISRTFHMPENADMESVEAKYSDGVLSLTIAKKSTNGSEKRKIAVQ